MAFLSTVIASRFPTTNNQLRSSFNPRNQATIQDGRVIVQKVQERQSQGYASNGSKSNATASGGKRNRGNYAAGQARVFKCYNFQGEGHMARQCTQPKRPRNSAWVKEKLMLVEAHRTDDLDAFDSDCDEAPEAQAILMAHLSCYDSDVISKMESVGFQNNTSSDQQNFTIMSVFDAISDQVVKCTTDNLKHKELDASLTTELENYKERVKQFEERQNVDLNDREKFIKSQMNDMILSQSTQTMHMLMKPQVFYDDTHKQAFGYQNPFYLKKAQRIKQTLYDGHVITKKHDVICVADTEETLILAIDRRTKMIEKQNGLISKDKKVNISPINYAELNKLSEDFGKRFVPQNELSAEQVFWLSNLIFKQPAVQPTPVKNIITLTITDAITEGAWAFEHTKEVFMKEVIPFLKSLKELFNEFDKDKKYIEFEKKELILDTECLLEHIICQDVMNVVMHVIVLPENDNCLAHDNFQMSSAINDYKCIEKSFMDEYNETLELKAELAKKNEMVDKDVYNELSNRCSRLENRCISLEIKLQQSKERLGKLGVSCSTEASRSQTKSNTEKNRITRTLRSNKKNNKVEDQPRIVKSSLNTVNHVSYTPCDANFKHSVLNANFELVCATCNECMFYAIHDSCVRVYLNDVNARVKSKSVKFVKSN
ncbi:hypothetical protein Tco_0491197 [Tanacetum coccineum]